jgi:hypothetical protein
MSNSDEGKTQNEPLVVSPRQAQRLLDVGNTKFYELLNAGEFEFFKQGKNTKILMASIHAYIERQVEAARAA